MTSKPLLFSALPTLPSSAPSSSLSCSSLWLKAVEVQRREVKEEGPLFIGVLALPVLWDLPWG